MKNQISPGASVPGVQSPTSDKPTGCDEAVREARAQAFEEVARMVDYNEDIPAKFAATLRRMAARARMERRVCACGEAGPCERHGARGFDR